MEFKVFVDNIQRVICGVNNETTCRDIVLCLAQATQQFGKFVLIEKWRQNERLLAPNELPVQILNKWGSLANEVHFIMRRSDHHQQIQIQQQQQQQQFLNNEEPIYSTVRQVYNNNAILHPINQLNQLNQLNQMNQMNQMNQINQLNNQMNIPMNNIQQPIYYQQQSNQLQQANNLIYKQNFMKPNFNSQQQDLTINQPIYATKYSTTQLPQQHSNINLMNLNQANQINAQFNQQQQQILNIQPQQNKQLLTIHQHSPHNLQSSPLNFNQTNQVYNGQINQLGQIRQINLQPQQYSPNLIKLNNNLINNNVMMNNQLNQMNQLNQINQLNQLNQLNNIQAQQQYELIKNNRPKCPPPYDQAITKSTLLHNNSPVNTSHSPSIYQQSQDYLSCQQQQQQNRYVVNNNSNTIKLNTVNSNVISSSTPSPNQLKSNNKTESYHHVNVAQLKSKFDNNALGDQLNVKKLDKKNLESILEKENQNVMKNLTNNNLLKKDLSSKELNKDMKNNKFNDNKLNLKDHQNLLFETYTKQLNCDNLNVKSDYQITNYQTDQLDVLQKETERIEVEKNEIANNINETDLKIAKCRQKIQVLMDEIKDVSIEKENEKIKIEEEITIKQISEIKQKIVQSIKEYESSSEKLTKLQDELDKLETTLNERKTMIDQLQHDIKEANLEGLTLVPLEPLEDGSMISENENKPPLNENCNNENNDNRFNVRLYGSTRRTCLKLNEDGEIPPVVQTAFSGFWV